MHAHLNATAPLTDSRNGATGAAHPALGSYTETARGRSEAPGLPGPELAWGALDLVREAILILDGRGAPRWANRSARELLAGCRGVKLAAEGLRAESTRDQAALDRLIGAGAVGRMRLCGSDPEAALEITVAPLGARDGERAVVLCDASASKPPPADRLRRLYGLTPMEARVASLVAGGQRVKDIATTLSISVHTVRGHLKQVFAKTGAHRQAELVRILISGSGALKV